MGCFLKMSKNIFDFSSPLSKISPFVGTPAPQIRIDPSSIKMATQDEIEKEISDAEREVNDSSLWLENAKQELQDLLQSYSELESKLEVLVGDCSKFDYIL